MGKWWYSSVFFYLSAIWRWVVKFTPWSVNIRGKNPRYALDKLVGPQSRPGLCGDQKNLQPLPGTQLGFLGRLACSPLLYRLCWGLAKIAVSVWRTLCKRLCPGPVVCDEGRLFDRTISGCEPCIFEPFGTQWRKKKIGFFSELLSLNG
jgi:hypothetical protein